MRSAVRSSRLQATANKPHFWLPHRVRQPESFFAADSEAGGFPSTMRTMTESFAALAIGQSENLHRSASSFLRSGKAPARAGHQPIGSRSPLSSLDPRGSAVKFLQYPMPRRFLY